MISQATNLTYNFQGTLSKESLLESIRNMETLNEKLDKLIRRLEFFDRDYQNVPLQVAKEIRDMVKNSFERRLTREY